MACFSPLDAWQTDDGDIVFKERGRIKRPLQLPCGQCVGCRLERSRRWAMRCVHESQMHDASSFVTLSYVDDNVPTSLRYSDFQKFMKRLRKQFPRSRFFMCGEYGETNHRPHFHACLFGVYFTDRVLYSNSGPLPLYRSATLEKLWRFGFSTVGDVTFESAGYCARYVMKKVTGEAAKEHYLRCDVRTGELVNVVPEFCRMSLKPGIGLPWLEKYFGDVYGWEKDQVIMQGFPSKPPRYYDKKIEFIWPELFDDIEFRRYKRSGRCSEDSTRERLLVRAGVARARTRPCPASGILFLTFRSGGENDF